MLLSITAISTARLTIFNKKVNLRKLKKIEAMINITEIAPLGIKLQEFEKFAKEVSFAMRCLWAGESGPLKIDGDSFSTNLLITSRVPAINTFTDNIKKYAQKVFTDSVVKRIIKKKEDWVTYEFNGQTYKIHFKEKSES